MADTTPGWVSNADLAQRMSEMLNTWMLMTQQIVQFVSYDGEGNITLTTIDGVEHSLKSFPQLEAEVTQWLDPLEGAVSQVQDLNSQAAASANAAASSASDAQTAQTAAEAARDAAADSETAAATSASGAATSASEAATSAANAASSASAAHTSETNAASSADDADDDAVAAAQSAQAAADSATQAAQSAAGKLAWFGVWDVSQGTLPPDPPNPGFYWVSGSATIGGEAYKDGDGLVWGTEGTWHHIDNQQTVASVAGLVGTIGVGALQDALNLGTAAYKATGDFATAAQGTKADAAMPKSGGSFTGDIDISGSFKLYANGAGGTDAAWGHSSDDWLWFSNDTDHTGLYSPTNDYIVRFIKSTKESNFYGDVTAAGDVTVSGNISAANLGTASAKAVGDFMPATPGTSSIASTAIQHLSGAGEGSWAFFGWDSSNFTSGGAYRIGTDGTLYMRMDGTTFFSVSKGGSTVDISFPVRLSPTADASPTSTGHAFQIGPDTGANLRMDGNEIMAANNGNTSPLYLQNDGGATSFGGDVSITGGLTLSGGKKLTKITVSSSAPGTLADGELYLRY